MVIPSNQCKEKIFLNSIEKRLLEFTPVCDLFDAYDRLFIPGSRTTKVDFTKGEILENSCHRKVLD